MWQEPILGESVIRALLTYGTLYKFPKDVPIARVWWGETRVQVAFSTPTLAVPGNEKTRM